MRERRCFELKVLGGEASERVLGIYRLEGSLGAKFSMPSRPYSSICSIIALVVMGEG